MRRIYCFGLLFVLLIACGKEEELTPSDYVKDWMIIDEPTTDDPVERLRYEIYKEYGVSTYYNDTLGKETRIDGLGTSYTHYELLKIFYNPGSTKPTGEYVLIKDRSILVDLLSSFKADILSRFDKGVKFKAFLFVDSLWSVSYSKRTRLNSYYGYNTMVVNVDSLQEWGVKKWNQKLLRDLLYSTLSSSTYSSWKTEFLSISEKLNPACDPLYSDVLSVTLEEAFAQTSFTKKEELGFMTSVFKNIYLGQGKYEMKECTPSSQTDFMSFLDAVLTYTDAEFVQKYGNYDVVIQKFKFLKQQLSVLGFHVSE